MGKREGRYAANSEKNGLSYSDREGEEEGQEGEEEAMNLL